MGSFRGRVTVDELIARLSALNIDHQEVYVQIQAPNSEPMEVTDFHFSQGGFRLVLTAEPKEQENG